MHGFLKFLSRQRWSVATQTAATVGAMVLITLVRVVAPLNTAPFLLFLPMILMLALALGWGSGLLGLLLSDLLAAFFFLQDHHGTFSRGQLIALVQYLLVGLGMIAICNSLRRAIIDNEATLDQLRASQDLLLAAKEEADQARGAAEAADRAKSAFLANMSHELRTPLSAVIGYSEMLEEQLEDASGTAMPAATLAATLAETLADLAKIKSNAKHLLSLINDVLDLSKVEANRMDIFAETLDVAGLVRDAAATLDPVVRQKSNTLVLEVAADVGSMHTDAVKLRQCLFNLIGNAAKFTDAGRITLRVTRAAEAGADWITFAVADTGIGMTAPEVARLFQRFVQADETTTRKFGGTGLGLALSRAFARLLGGEITVASTPGEGSVFTLRLPAAAPAAPAEPDRSAGIEPADGDAPQRDLVLVIDDEASQRDLTGRFLRRQGFAVATATDGVSGMAQARALQPAAILLDVMMPGMDGWTVLKMLKDDPATASIPVIMVSFVAEPALSIAMGATDAVAKPVNWDRLGGILDRFHAAAGQVLVVDDDPQLHDRLRGLLQRGGWSMAEAHDGQQALELVRQSRPQVILLDLAMPVMDGFAFLHALRDLPDCADIPVVVLSARDVSAAERAELTGADRILRKDATSLQELAVELRQIGKPGGPD